VVGLFAGCATPPPPGAELGPHGTIAYNVRVEASAPGVRIETNRVFAGITPLTIKLFGDKDGTFHDFGSYFYLVQAFPIQTNEYVQTKWFRTGRMFTPEDYVPGSIYFEMTEVPPATSPVWYPGPGYPGYYGPGIFIGPGPMGPGPMGPGPMGPGPMGPGPMGPGPMGPGPGGPGPGGPGPGGPGPH
jgi:hypothetical protein